MISHPVKGGYFENIDGEEGISFTITNRGWKSIPEYKLCLFHPQRGGLFVFRTEQPAPLLGGQEDHHEWAILKHTKPDEFVVNWFFHVANMPVTDVDTTGFTLQIIMSKSRKVLWESEALGKSLATQAVQVIKHSSFKGGILPDVLDLYTSPRKTLLERARKLCRHR